MPYVMLYGLLMSGGFYETGWMFMDSVYVLQPHDIQ